MNLEAALALAVAMFSLGTMLGHAAGYARAKGLHARHYEPRRRVGNPE